MADIVDAGSEPDTGGVGDGKYGNVPIYTKKEFMDTKYKMDGSPGLAIIFNNKTFKDKTSRTGTDKDAENINQRFRELGFKVKIHQDKTSFEMQSLIDEAAKSDFSDYDCFACVILSYGEEGLVYGTDEPVQVEHFVDPFKQNNSLAGKPKLFFIQACNQEEPEGGEDVSDAMGVTADGGDDEELIPETYRIPAEADFFIAYSVIPGYFSWQGSVENGSWFIRALSDVLGKFGTSLDLMTMMIRVNRQVAYDFELNKKNEFIKRKKQIACITSMLTKDVCFSSQ
ncbi:caspase-3-like [Haliotis rufescens]|uniref:caspase-3-like n=1 Tax=Haliotis rufescens TaxID=6454 RepID=UPI00201F6E81|nr:caspase-3-like [Haliotis rufescens]